MRQMSKGMSEIITLHDLIKPPIDMLILSMSMDKQTHDKKWFYC